MSKDLYEERYCAFVDILDFRTLVHQLQNGETDYKRVRTLLQEIYEPVYGDSGAFKQSDIQVQSIPDAVALSTAANPAGLSQLIHSLEQLYIQFLFLGFFSAWSCREREALSRRRHGVR
jgi:hypothetical protein